MALTDEKRAKAAATTIVDVLYRAYVSNQSSVHIHREVFELILAELAVVRAQEREVCLADIESVKEEARKLVEDPERRLSFDAIIGIENCAAHIRRRGDE